MDRYFDNTRIQSYRECERKFYYRHIRDWAPDGTKAALAFGGAWHQAMDQVWAAYCGVNQAAVDQQLVIGNAMRAFEEKWTSEGFCSLEEFLAMSLDAQKALMPRTPMVAAEMIYGYIEAREHAMRFNFEPVEGEWIERPFAVPLDPEEPNLFYVGRFDKVVRRRSDGSIFGIEHKTTTAYKKDGFFKGEFIEGFSPNSQVRGYNFAGKMIWGPAKFKGILVDAALVHRDVHEGFKLIPVEEQLPMLEDWLWNTHRRIQSIEGDMDRLEYIRRVKAGGPTNDTIADLQYLSAFPQKTEACTAYGNTCPFIDLCRSKADPEAWEQPPKGFRVERWSPFDELELAKIGLPAPEESSDE